MQAFSERPLPRLRDADAPWVLVLNPAYAGHAHAWTWREQGGLRVLEGGMARPSWGGVGRVGDY